MNNCEHCGKELDRKIFCNNSHRAMYYKKGKLITQEDKKLIEEDIDHFNPVPKPKK